MTKFMRSVAAALALVMIMIISGCSSAVKLPPVTYLIGVSQANLREPWRLVLMRELQDEAAKHPDLRLIITDAAQNSDKQIQDIRQLLSYGIDLLIISPCDVKKLTPAIGDVYKNIPVIVLDRVAEGYDYSLFIGPDNENIGKLAGEAIAGFAAKSGKADYSVLELRGGADSLSSNERSAGLNRVLNAYPNITVSSLMVGSESRDGAEDSVKALGRAAARYDLVFAYNDYMAMGAYRAFAGALTRPVIIGVDGFAGADGGLDLIRGGDIDETITCPTGGREAIQYALDILNHSNGVPKQIILRNRKITADNVENYARDLEKAPRGHAGPIRVGYAQAGTESGWRITNNNSITEAARDFGVDLTVIDADGSVDRQIEAVRTFIKQRQEVIVIPPIVGSGWDDVLMEAKAAGIPVLLSDRSITSRHDDLYLTFIGADFIEEGRRAMRWVAANVPSSGHTVRILEIEGTIGATPTLGRKSGFEMVMNENSGYRIVYSKSGDFTYEGGRAVVEGYLKEYGMDFDVIFAHNDDMALGAADAIEASGGQPGKDVKIVSVDGTQAAIKAIKDGRLNCSVECNPQLGPQLMKAIIDLMKGKDLPLRIITDETVFTRDNLVKKKT